VPIGLNAPAVQDARAFGNQVLLRILSSLPVRRAIFQASS
jgi:hypothetical protein